MIYDLRTWDNPVPFSKAELFAPHIAAGEALRSGGKLYEIMKVIYLEVDMKQIHNSDNTAPMGELIVQEVPSYAR